MSITRNHGEHGLWEFNDANHCECSLCGYVVTDAEAYKLKECPDCGAFMGKQEYTLRDAETVPVVTEKAETEQNAAYWMNKVLESAHEAWENLHDTVDFKEAIEQAEAIKKQLGIAEHDAEKESKKSICNNCFWWNKTCHNKKSCCYGDYKDYNGFCGWFEPANTETNQEPEYDPVKKPKHYCKGGVECLDAIKAALGDKYEGFLAGNVLKYVYRYPDKNGVEDCKKARFYLDKLIEVLSNEER